MKVKRGKLEELMALTKEKTEATEAEEAGTTQYEWSFNEDGTRCHLYERYTDSDAVLAHLGNFRKKYADRFFGILEMDRWHVYGPASKQVKEAFSPMGAIFMDRKEGFVRV